MSDWSELDAFLGTDPADVGCDEAIRILHVYVELVTNGEEASTRHPGVAAHLRACGPCGADFEGLLGLITDPPPDGLRRSFSKKFRRRR
jgi:hypothetical protein